MKTSIDNYQGFSFGIKKDSINNKYYLIDIMTSTFKEISKDHYHQYLECIKNFKRITKEVYKKNNTKNKGENENETKKICVR